MPLVTTTEMFKKAYNGGYAIGAFNVNNMEIFWEKKSSLYIRRNIQANLRLFP